MSQPASPVLGSPNPLTFYFSARNASSGLAWYLNSEHGPGVCPREKSPRPNQRMSNSFFERVNPPPRRKTCLACIKAKRRCDHGQPACLRCSRRKIDCVYSSPPTSKSKRQTNHHTTQSLGKSLPEERSEGPAEVFDSATEAAPYRNNSLIPWSQDPDLLPLDMENLDHTSLNMGFDDLLASETLFDGPLSLSSLTPKPDRMLVPSQDVVPEGSLEEMIASRLQFALDEIKKAPTSIVLKNKTPWSHPFLYRAHMPREMQDAQACCALYISKNPANAPFVLRTVQARAHELFSSPMPKERLDVLARLNAAIIYQIIGIFDGNISMRGSAQQTLPALEHITLALLPFVRWESGQFETSPEGDHSTCPTKEIWHEWIFQESARRSIFFACFFLVIYSVLVGQPFDGCGRKYLFCQSWTLSAHLWEAPNVVDFAIAWREKCHFIVTKQDFSEVLRDASADDIDTFGRMLMVGALGIDETRLWFYNRGSSL